MNPNDPQLSYRIEPPLTRREYFAALAMQGLLANTEQWKYIFKNELDAHAQISGLSREFSDALIAELSKEKH